MKITLKELKKIIKEQVDSQMAQKQKIFNAGEKFKNGVVAFMKQSKNRVEIVKVTDKPMMEYKLIMNLELGEQVGTLRFEKAQLILELREQPHVSGVPDFGYYLAIKNKVGFEPDSVLKDTKLSPEPPVSFKTFEDFDRQVLSQIDNLIQSVKNEIIPPETEIKRAQDYEETRRNAPAPGKGAPITPEELDILKNAGLELKSPMPDYMGRRMVGVKEQETIEDWLSKWGADRKKRPEFFEAIAEKRPMYSVRENILRMVREEVKRQLRSNR